ncbi:MAG TPA: hypothetical protein VGO56_16280 [Pyrinomonadaceae bacterium]|jgi:hypothetical protein|nr:hypothetical protein [Pyrinomonadaceae bacterium]
MILLENQELKADDGLWRIEYIGPPNAPRDTDRIDYYLRFKWIDPQNRDNMVTPERRLRLVAYRSESAFADCESKLRQALTSWLNSDVESGAKFDYDSASLRQIES